LARAAGRSYLLVFIQFFNRLEWAYYAKLLHSLNYYNLKKQFFLLFTLVFSLHLPVFSQEEALIESVSADSVYVINSFVFNIEGITRENILTNLGGFKEGEEITGVFNLERYIQEKTQLLINQRVLESASIDYSIGQVLQDGRYPVDLVINVKDTGNFVILPKPQYSTSYGFSFILGARHYNFLGLMSPFKLDLGYKYDEQGRNNYLLTLEANTPFTARGINWNISFINDFEYRPDLDNPLYYKNTTGLSAVLPLGLNTVTFGIHESIVVNEEIAVSDNTVYSDCHSFDAGYNLGISRIDWIGNFQKGFNVKMNQTYSYNFYANKYDTNRWGIYNEFAGIGHFIVSDFFFFFHPA
jgi:hypothetical protein